ncbi:uracil-DNA glycosylase [bacterium]|nr:uracil-DNA glycosylase [candidate division CSSED10-310 bacterium]
MEPVRSSDPDVIHLISNIKSHLRYLTAEGIDSLEIIAPALSHLTPVPSDASPDMRSSSDNSQDDNLYRLRVHIGECTRCKLSKGRNNLVFGEGNSNPDIVFVGEGPGVDEDRQGIPFVGAAGQLLNRIIEAMGLTRNDIYICNIVKCHPPGNRDPEPDEIDTCGRFLAEQIRILNPKVILCLGRISGRFLTGQEPNTRLWAMRGKFYRYNGIDVRVTYHPSAVLRDPKYRRPVWEDVQAVMAHLGRPIQGRER